MIIEPLLSVFAISLISLVGIFTLSLKENILRKYIYLLVALAVGALLGDSFIHLIPEAYEELGNSTIVALLVIAGIFIFLILEKLFHWHHHSPEHTHSHTPKSTGQVILISDGLHNFIDGLIIGGSYLISPEIGFATTLAVIFHEIPQEIGDFGVLLHAGYSKTKALWLNFLSALVAIVGVIIAVSLGELAEPFALWLLPIAAGGFIYIALADLIPQLNKINKLSSIAAQAIAILVGIASMLALLTIEPEHGHEAEATHSTHSEISGQK